MSAMKVFLFLSALALPAITMAEQREYVGKFQEKLDIFLLIESRKTIEGGIVQAEVLMLPAVSPSGTPLIDAPMEARGTILVNCVSNQGRMLSLTAINTKTGERIPMIEDSSWIDFDQDADDQRTLKAMCEN